jgi:hypothetical protein
MVRNSGEILLDTFAFPSDGYETQISRHLFPCPHDLWHTADEPIEARVFENRDDVQWQRCAKPHVLTKNQDPSATIQLSVHLVRPYLNLVSLSPGSETLPKIKAQ